MKRQLISLCFLLLLLLVVSLPGCQGENKEETSVEDTRIEQAKADGKPVVIVSNVEGKIGDTVRVAANLVNNPGILGMSMTLSYDENVLKLKNVDNGKVFKDVLEMSHSKELKSGCVFLWDGENITDEQISDGEILVMEFEILKKDDSGVPTVQFVCSEGSAVDKHMETVELGIEKGVVTIQK